MRPALRGRPALRPVPSGEVARWATNRCMSRTALARSRVPAQVRKSATELAYWALVLSAWARPKKRTSSHRDARSWGTYSSSTTA